MNSDFASDYPKFLNILTSALESNLPQTKPSKKKKRSKIKRSSSGESMWDQETSLIGIIILNAKQATFPH